MTEQAVAHDLLTRPWRFVKGVVSLEGLPEADCPEIAVAGRSNVGKSSLINAALQHKGLARASRQPGRTQEINFFALDDEAGAPRAYMVDLPGYGYAVAAKSKIKAWTRLIKDYLRGRPNLKRVFLLIDARHGVKSNDHEIMALLDESAVSYQVVLTKLDKLNRADQEKAHAAAVLALKTHVAAHPRLLASSAQKAWGLDDLRQAMLAALFDLDVGCAAGEELPGKGG